MTDTPLGFDHTVPSSARMYDYYLGGKDNFPADRDAAEAVIAAQPHAPQLARNNRGFLRGATRFIAEQGVDQFIDIGTGVPTSPNVHEVVRSVRSDARIVYVDNDPVVLAHDRALLAEDSDVTIVDGDMLDPGGILANEDLLSAIDFDQPVGVLFVSVLHFSRERHPRDLVAPFRDRMVPGSYLAISHACVEGMSVDEIASVEENYRNTPNGLRFRTPEDIESVFDGFEVIEPGLVDVSRWRQFEKPTHIQIFAAVGRRV